MNSGLLLDLWFNAHYFHSEEEKVSALAQLNAAFSESFSKYMLLDGTYEAAKVVLTVYGAMRDMVQEHATGT